MPDVGAMHVHSEEVEGFDPDGPDGPDGQCDTRINKQHASTKGLADVTSSEYWHTHTARGRLQPITAISEMSNLP